LAHNGILLKKSFKKKINFFQKKFKLPLFSPLFEKTTLNRLKYPRYFFHFLQQLRRLTVMLLHPSFFAPKHSNHGDPKHVAAPARAPELSSGTDELPPATFIKRRQKSSSDLFPVKWTWAMCTRFSFYLVTI
jgi:hypothetical protein